MYPYRTARIGPYGKSQRVFQGYWVGTSLINQPPSVRTCYDKKKCFWYPCRNMPPHTPNPPPPPENLTRLTFPNFLLRDRLLACFLAYRPTHLPIGHNPTSKLDLNTSVDGLIGSAGNPGDGGQEPPTASPLGQGPGLQVRQYKRFSTFVYIIPFCISFPLLM